MTDPASHLDLLATARRVRRAVTGRDTERLQLELAGLHAAVLDHVRAERELLDSLPAAAAAVAFRGQRRLLRLLTDLRSASSDRRVSLSQVAEIERTIRRQARLETALIQRHVPGGPENV